MFRFIRGWGMRRHHVVGAGFLASVIGMYPIAARLGLVPTNVSSAVRWITNTGGPLAAALPPGMGGQAGFGPAAGQAPYATDTSGAAVYPAAGYATAGYAGANYGAAYGAGDIACYFSPAGGCTDAVVNEIRQARQQILVQAYSFTSVPIATALVEAHQRGVGVYIVLDKSQRTEQYSGADFVARAGIPTLIDAKHAIAHNKIMLIDRLTIITGSFNFTTNAEKSNAENLLVIRNRPELYQAYENNFRHHYEHSEPYQGRGG
jgi:phosphatidylserine/phosphatidylglycerophosphate/cardiolipin synthase-like enzyme